MKSFLAVVAAVVVVAAVLAPQPGAAVPLKRSSRNVADCPPPDNVADLFRNLNTHVNASMLLQPNQLGEPSRLLPSELNSGDVVLGMLYGGRDCPKDVETSPDAPLMARSTCPWFLELEELPAGKFYPGVLPQAVCRCRQCLRQSGLGCEQVTTQVRVLEYTGCSQGFKTYQVVTRRVSVGCTCAAAGSHVVGGNMGAPDLAQ